MTEEDKTKKEDERKRLLDSAKSLIESGMEPHQVGQMLLGLTPTGIAPAPAQGMVMKDVMEMVTFMVGKRDTDELKTIVVNLAKQVDDIAKGGGTKTETTKPVDPVTFAVQQADAIVAWNKAIEILRPSSPSTTVQGEPIEVVKERNRHEEKLEEMKADREHKINLASIAGDIPERIGRGLAGKFTEDGGGGGSSDGGGLDYKECEDCNTKIFITPETGNEVVCPKCDAVYTITSR